MSAILRSPEEAQLADLVELAGSAEEVQDVVRELEAATGRPPKLAEVVEAIMDRKREGVLSGACWED